MDHLEYAIYRMAHDFEGGVTALAQRINVRPGTLIAKVDPANDAATTNVRELVAMLLTTGDIRPLAEIARACGYVLTPAAARDDGAALLDATGRRLPLAEIARACGYVLTPAAARDDGAALLDATLDAGAAHGDLMASARDALRDGEIDAQELAAIREAATASTMAAEHLN